MWRLFLEKCCIEVDFRRYSESKVAALHLGIPISEDLAAFSERPSFY